MPSTFVQNSLTQQMNQYNQQAPTKPVTKPTASLVSQALKIVKKINSENPPKSLHSKPTQSNRPTMRKK